MTRKVGEPAAKPAGNRGKGRPKGSQNRLTASAKAAFEFAFDRIGGGERLAQWADENPSDFFKLYARLIPVDVTSGGVSIADALIAARDRAKRR